MDIELRRTHDGAVTTLYKGSCGAMALQFDRGDDISVWIIQDSGEETLVPADKAMFQVIQLREH